MTSQELIHVRPARILRVGEIPAELPSVYDFIDAQFGANNFVKAPLMGDYQRNETMWDIETSETAGATHVHIASRTFIDAYVHDMQYGNTNWDKRYKKLAVLCAQGWIREAKDEGLIDRVSVFTIPEYAKALKEHLELAEHMWGVEWLTSDRPLVGQNDREVEALGTYLDDYHNTTMTGSEFFLNFAGDILINQIRSASTPEQLAKWQATADKFKKKTNKKR